MKKLCLLIAFICIGAWSLNAQVPNQFSYQAIARNKDGTPLSNSLVKIKFTILKNGASIFDEEKDFTSNEFGIITHNIGSVKNIPSLTNPPYRIKVDFGNGMVSETDLLSVPFALVADTVLRAPKTSVALTAGTGISIVNNTITNTGDLDIMNEIQTLSINGNVISLTKNGGSVNIPVGPAGADAQTLSLLGNKLAISNGNSVDLSPYLDDTDKQTLSIVGSQLSILNGNSITLPTSGGNVTTDNTLTGNGTTTTPLSIKDAGITAVKLASMGATQGQVLKWNATTNKWNPETDLVGVSGGIQTLSANNGRLSLSNGGGDVILGTGLSATGNLLSLSFQLPTTLPPSGAASGDLGGTYPNPSVVKLQGRAISPTLPTNGQVLKFNTSNNTWEPNTDNTGGGAGPTYIAGTGIDIISNTISIKPGTIPIVLPPTGAANGDLTGSYPAPTIKSIQGKPIDFTTAPTIEQILRWNGTSWTASPDTWTSASGIVYRPTGNVGIGIVVPTEKLHVNGNIGITSSGSLLLNNNTGKETIRITTSSSPANEGNGSILFSNRSGGVRTFIGTSQDGTAGYMKTYGSNGKPIFLLTALAANENAGLFGLVAPTDSNTVVGGLLMETDNTATIFGTTIKGVSIIPNTVGSNDIGTSTKQWRDIYATSGVVKTSDSRLKDNIKNSPYGLSDILKLRPVSYFLKKDELKQTQMGFIAQEVEPIIPEIVVKPSKPEEFYAMRYEQLIPVLTKAIQEQQAIINDLKKTVSEVNAKNERLEKGMENLESKLDAVLKRLNIEERNPTTGGTEGGATSQLPQNSKKQN
jgi:hypothetical protein